MILAINTSIAQYFIYFAILAIIATIISVYYSTYIADAEKRNNSNFKINSLILSILVSGGIISTIAVLNHYELESVKKEAISKIEKKIVENEAKIVKLNEELDIKSDEYGNKDVKFFRVNISAIKDNISNVKNKIKEEKENIDYIKSGKFLVVGDELIPNKIAIQK